MGAVKKIVVANRVALYVDAVYNNAELHSGLTLLIATYLFAFQIYCDFSGYSDIAIGAARVMGYDLMKNFNRPYFAKTINEFWSRWHISLSTWFRDYVYIPLGGNRVPRWRVYANLLIVFLVSGLWHGANWTFVVWGALHGSYVVFEVWSKRAREKVARILHIKRSPIWTILATLVTFHLVCFAWIFFQAGSTPHALVLVRNLTQFGLPTDIYAPWQVSNPRLEMAFALGLILLVAIVQVLQYWKPRAPTFVPRPTWVRWFVYLTLALAIMNLGVATETPFIYFQF